MEISIWLVATSITKILLYFCTAAALSGVALHGFNFSNPLLKRAMTKYLIITSIIGGLLTVINFLIQVGAITESGLSGMFDTTFASILWQSKLGDSVLLKVIGFSVVLIASVMFSLEQLKNAQYTRIFTSALYTVSVILLGYSFGLVGHTAELSIGVKVATILHVVLVLWWIGMLYPLYRSCTILNDQELHRLMHRFGIVASYAVSLLIICGGIIALSLFDSFDTLFFSGYGQLFLTKLLLVNGLLVIALNHKLRLVPALIKTPSSNLKLAQSIKIETLVAILILVTTAALTTFVGPEHT